MEEYTKHNVELHEYNMHKYVYDLNIVNIPKIISYDEKTKIMIMEKIPFMNVSDFYGEDAINISNELFNNIRNVIKILYSNNIEYSDITGYNFIEYDDKIWIIDFEHSQLEPDTFNPFMIKFINGFNDWNPDFR
uniref:non-specific serine/threonine protein kinase n=1 Tax=viral metagenome TaxID=1070528 RepID=A0A6C0D8P9_9ZZZZ